MPPKKESSKNKSASKKKGTTCTRKLFPRRKMHDLLVHKFPDGQVHEEASDYLRSIMEYLAVEILELSVNSARTRLGGSTKEVEVTLNDLMEAINSDKELKELVDSTWGGAAKE